MKMKKLIAIMVTAALFAGILPFAAFADKLQATRQQRSIFAKSAMQVAQLAVLLQSFGVVALLADLLLDGCVNRFMQGVWRPIWVGTIACLAVALLFSLLAVSVGKSKNTSGAPNSACLVLSGLAALIGAALAFICVWVFLRGGSLPLPAEGETLASSFAALLAATAKLSLAVYALICLVLAWVGAQAQALVWYLVLRRRDDFGRDYYTLMLRAHAKQASTLSGLVLLPLMVGALGFIPTFSSLRLLQVLPWTANVNMVVLSIGTLCLPLAAACWFLLYRAELPLRKKTLAIVAVPLVLVWFFSLLARVWI